MSRAPHVSAPMAGGRLARWMLFYTAMALVDAVVVVAVVTTA